MKKFGVFVLIIIVFASFFVSAQPSNDSLNILTANKSATTGQTGEAFSKAIIIPEYLHLPMQIIFGISAEGEIPVGWLIVLLASWLTGLFLLQNIFALLPFMNTRWQSWLGAFLVLLLVTMTGVINTLISFFFAFANSFDIIATWGFLSVIFGIIIAALILFLGRFLLHKFKESRDRTYTEEVGENIRVMGEKAEIDAEDLKKYGENE